MRFKRSYLKLGTLFLIVWGLYAFASHRSKGKVIDGTEVRFMGDQNLYITQGTVNKLLIQKTGGLDGLPKEKLVLNAMEKAVTANEMVKDAQVYLTVDGKLTSKIVQRKPIGRVEEASNYYLDDEGKRMPLSAVYSARVPIITGKITGESLKDVYEILTYINTDDFLRKNVIGIHVEKTDSYQLKFRMEHFTVHLGSIENLGGKFENFKVFYAKAQRDDKLKEYAMVNLAFNSQVVCTKI